MYRREVCLALFNLHYAVKYKWENNSFKMGHRVSKVFSLGVKPYDHSWADFEEKQSCLL